MRIFNLRAVDRAAMHTRYVLGHWQRQGQPVLFQYLNPQAVYIAFQADSAHTQWQGVIEARAWLGHFSPALAALASAACDEKQILALFTATPRPFNTRLVDLSYDSLQVKGLAVGAALSQEPLIRITTDHGEVTLLSLPNTVRKDTRSDWLATTASLPLNLRFELGRSLLSMAMLSRLSIGDVLLITTEMTRINTNGVVLGRYLLTEEGITMDHQDQEFDSFNTDAENEQRVPFDNSMQPQPQDPVQAALARVPVQLEFILQEKTLTVAELGQFYQGQLLALDPAAEASIVIRANGVLLAKGELVQLDDRLGVEITTLYGGAHHVE